MTPAPEAAGPADRNDLPLGMNPVTDATVLLAIETTDPDLREAAAAACRKAGVRPLPLERTNGASRSRPDVDPWLLVGVLPAGERAIPDRLLQLVTVGYPGLPLLLLCRETLVRDVVVLNDGRVTLLGPPHAPEKVAAAIRSSLAPGPVAPGEWLAGRRLRIFRGPQWWAAALSRREPPAPDSDPGYPMVESGADGSGIAAVVPPADAPPPPQEAARALVERLRQYAAVPAAGVMAGVGGSGMGGSGYGQRFASEFGSDFGSPGTETPGGMMGAGVVGAGVVGAANDGAAAWLSGDASRWRLLQPAAGGGVWLLSSQRLPTVWSPSPDTPAGAIRSLPAGRGDLLLLTGHPGGAPWPGAEPSEAAPALRSLASGGGAALLEFLEARLAESDAAFSAVIVEVR